jgi:hypothetical protein
MENDAKIEIFESGTISEENKTKRKLLGIVSISLAIAVLFFVVALFSTKNCFNEANRKTDELLNIRTSMTQNGYAGIVPNKEQTFSYALNMCVKNNPLASPSIAKFSFNFVFETLLIFLFLWLISKKDKAESLIRASVVAFYFSILSSLGTSFASFQIILILGGLGVVSKMLHFNFVKRLIFITGLLLIQYGTIFLLLKLL